MSFFPPDPEMPDPDESEPQRSPWWTAPADRVPVIYPAAEVLAASEQVAIAIIGVYVYNDGVEFHVERRLRRNGLAHDEWQKLIGEFTEHWHGRGRTGEERLRYGLVLETGERVVDGSPFFGVDDPTTRPEGHSFVRGGGGGSGGGHSYSAHDALWLWPLPPAGSVEFVVQWPAMGIAETRTYLDASSFADLAKRSVPFWPSAI